MIKVRPSVAQLLLLLAMAGVLYFWRLADAPVYLGGDEARFAIHAHAIASTGRDLDGRFMPLFIRLEELNWWYQPTLFYLIAATLKIFPLSEGTIRIPTAAIGLLDLFLMYAVVRRLSIGRWYPALALVMLALTPAHFIFSREARDFICILPFVLGWLWCVTGLVETGGATVAALSGILLGVGMYSHIAAWVFMPLYALFTGLAALLARKSVWLALAAALGFGLSVLPLAIWLRSHPGVVQSIIGGYHVYDAHHLSPLQGLKDLLNYNSVQERLSVYWDYFNPAYLFFAGGSNLAIATRRAGVFPYAIAPALLGGVYELWQRRRTAMAQLLLAGFATAPLGAVLVDDRYAPQRELVVVPFGILISTFGVALLWRQRERVRRGAAVLLVAAVPVQFAFFCHDYFTGYQIRSAYWFDPTDFRDIAAYLIAAASSRDVPSVYLSNTIDDAIPRWRFYLAKQGRPELWARTHFFSRDNLDVGRVSTGSLLVIEPKDPQLAELLGPGRCCSIVHRVIDVAQSESALILVRDTVPPRDER